MPEVQIEHHGARPAIVIAGRDIQRYGPDNGNVWLDDEKHTIRARVETIGGYSAHADQQGLVEFVAGMKEKPKDIRLVHGVAKNMPSKP